MYVAPVPPVDGYRMRSLLFGSALIYNTRCASSRRWGGGPQLRAAKEMIEPRGAEMGNLGTREGA